MSPSAPVQAFDETTLDGDPFWCALLEDTHVHDPTAAAFTKEAAFRSPTVTQLIERGDYVILGKLKKGKLGSCAESAC